MTKMITFQNPPNEGQPANGSDPQAYAIALIPEPKHVQQLAGVVTLPAMGRITYIGPDSNDGSYAETQLALEVADSIERCTALKWDCARSERWNSDIELIVDGSLENQAYTVDINKFANPAIAVHGGSIAGLRSGVQTLRQIICQTAFTLPCIHIEDKPTFAVRSYSLDVTRGRVPTMEWLKHWADKLSYYKYNQLQLYVEHSFEFDGLSESWRGVSPLAPRDIQEFDDYCRRRGIELVPSLSTFGHHYMNLRTHTLRMLGELPEDADRHYSFIERQEHHTLNITLPEAFEFSTRIIDDYGQLFHSKKFNIGADETFDLGKGASKEEAERIGTSNMYADYVTRLCNHILEGGGKPMFWGDIAMAMPEMLKQMPMEYTLLNWLYSPEVDESKVRLVADTGMKQYVCAAIHDWNNLLPDFDAAFKNITRLNKFGQQYGAIGAMVTDWGDYGGVNDPRLSVPGMIYAAQYSWNPQGPDFEEMNRRISLLEYGDMSGEYLDTLVEAHNSISFGWEDMVKYRELDDGNGGLNQDINLTLKGQYGKDKWGTVTNIAEARLQYLTLGSGRIGNYGEANERLRALKTQLGTILSRRTAVSDARDSAQAQIVAIDGQLLFNELGYTLACRTGALGRPTTPGVSRDACHALAARIEEWFETYRSVWRQVSRESELRRISDVVWGYADMLREGWQ